MKSYILGDIHSEYKKSLEILKYVKVVNEKGHLKGGFKDRLIQVGDVIDRGENALKSFYFIRELQEEAKKEGGEVVRLLGNHELGYIGGPIVSNRTEGYFLADTIKRDILDGKIIAAYLLDDWIVVHAGITEKFSKGKEKEELVDELNKRLLDAVKNNDFDDEMFFVGESRGGYREPGIFWADYDIDLLPYEDALVNQIVGHSPNLKAKPAFRKSPNGKIIGVDIGMCKQYGGHMGILLYEDKKFRSIIIE